MDRAKSAAVKSPEPPLVPYTASENVTVSELLSALRLTELIAGTVALTNTEDVLPTLLSVRFRSLPALSLSVPPLPDKEPTAIPSASSSPDWTV
jgi:hypothetical protein